MSVVATFTKIEQATIAEWDASWTRAIAYYGRLGGRWIARVRPTPKDAFAPGGEYTTEKAAVAACAAYRVSVRGKAPAPRAKRLSPAAPAQALAKALAPPSPPQKHTRIRGKSPAPVTREVRTPAPKRAARPATERPSTVVRFYEGADPKARRRIESIVRRGFPLVSLPLKPVVVKFGGAQRMSYAEAARVVDMSGLHVADTWPKLLDLLKRRCVAGGDYPEIAPSDYLKATGHTFNDDPESLQWSCGCKGLEADEPCSRHARCVSWEAFNKHEDAAPRASRKGKKS